MQTKDIDWVPTDSLNTLCRDKRINAKLNTVCQLGNRLSDLVMEKLANTGSCSEYTCPSGFSDADGLRETFLP